MKPTGFLVVLFVSSVELKIIELRYRVYPYSQILLYDKDFSPMNPRLQLVNYETEIPLEEITGQEKVTGLFVSQLNTIIIIDHVGIPRVKFIMLYKAVKTDEHDKGQKLTSFLNPFTTDQFAYFANAKLIKWVHLLKKSPKFQYV